MQRGSARSELRSNQATKAIVGEKVGMTQVWDEDNRVVPVTVLRVTPCRVVQVKTPETDGYSAIQVTLGVKDANKLTQPEAGTSQRRASTPAASLSSCGSTTSASTSAFADILGQGEKDVTAVSRGKASPVR